ncbi:TetR/AcrR family transcriptional regulator [Nocardia sp. NBC_01327]|uniref:TetR/AcrR family transcriptional regulator n=1 Tax=Nocardia sp. NBC_01327 TaxID=2903593 RepID=UPI002E0F6E0D|nr:TetR/AcrR family transcriptional regulator [Nocardia sp. NBC_01327]
MPPAGSRPLRADAQLNHDRVLEAAAQAFAREGTQASLKAIAKDAGVGIGTLYRRFPTRETLVEATYRNEVTRLCDSALDLLSNVPAPQALRTWMDHFIDFMATKNAMADALRTLLVSEADIMHTRALLTDALAELLTAGAADKTIRSDINPTDVLMSLGGITLIAGELDQRDLARRLLDLLMDGLRYSPPTA